MASSEGLKPIFADISALVEYCSPYFEEHHYASEVVNEYVESGGTLVVSETAWLGLNDSMSNRERMWNHLIKKATGYMKNGSGGATEFRSDVLNYTALNQALGFEFSDEFLPDIEELKDELNNDGLSGFRESVDDARIQGSSQRVELEQIVNPSEYSRGGNRGSWTSQTTLAQYTANETQVESLMDSGHWRRENEGTILLGSMSKPANNQAEVKSVIEDISNTETKVLTPKEVYQRVPIFG